MSGNKVEKDCPICGKTSSVRRNRMKVRFTEDGEPVVCTKCSCGIWIQVPENFYPEEQEKLTYHKMLRKHSKGICATINAILGEINTS